MGNEFWLTIEEVSELTGEVQETVRRKCKRGEYDSIFSKNGKYKTYYIALESLPEYIKKKYFGIKNSTKHSKFFKEAPPYAKKQAKKYLELINLTKDMKHKEIVEFLKKWNEEYPDKKSSYSALCKAKTKFEKWGEDALLSKKGVKSQEYCIKPEYYEYYKNLYLSEKKYSVYECWLKTLYFAIENHKINPGKFPNERTFDRLLKQDVPQNIIKYKRSYYEKAFAKDLSNIKANEYWYVESYQLKFPIKFKGLLRYTWVTAVKDIKTSKWLGWFLYHYPATYNHVSQAIYYAATKYGFPKNIYIKNSKISSSLNSKGIAKELDINTFNLRLLAMLNDVKSNISEICPSNLHLKPIAVDLKHFKAPSQNVDLFELKKLLDNYVEKGINKKYFRTKFLAHKTPDTLWEETYIPGDIPVKDDIKHFCLRFEKPINLGRNGTHDSLTGKTYWSKKSSFYKGRKVFLRRDIYSDDNAKVYNGENEAFIDTVEIVPSVAALWKTKEERELLKIMLAKKKCDLKYAKSFIKDLERVPIQEQYENYRIVYKPKHEHKLNPKVIILTNTKMDIAIRKAKEMEEAKKLSEGLLEFQCKQLDNPEQ